MGIEKFYNYVVGRAAFPVLLSFLFLFITSLFFTIQSVHIFLAAVAASLQAVIPLLNKIDGSLVGYEVLSSKKNLVSRSFKKRVPLLLSVTPVLAGMSIILGMIWVVGICILSVNPLAKILAKTVNREKIKKEMVSKVEGYNPKIAVYVTGIEGVAYQINQWLPVLEKIDSRVIVVVRERAVYYGMLETKIPVLFARTQLDLENLLSEGKGLKTVLYPANTMKNVQALRYFKLKHYFINHGESDKAVNQSKLLMAYDKLLVGGPLAERRLIEAGLPIRPNQVVYVGRPQAEILLNKIESPQPIKTVLYAPTWEGFVDSVNYSSVNTIGLLLVQSIASTGNYRVIFRPHPYTGSKNSRNKSFLEKIKSYCDDSDYAEVCNGDATIYQRMNESDILITDVSSVLNEYLVTKKPIIICNSQGVSRSDMNKSFPSSEAAYQLDEGSEAVELIESIEKNDRLWNVRDRIRKESLGDFDEGAVSKFKKEVENEVRHVES